jgi:chromosome segregation protein
LQLQKLEAYGFKSFADKLEIEFDKGITAIVGPNGSGKSNITDAIKWVLGEQNVRNLRGIKTEDIIFSGSSTRRALGVAEVSLTFDNSDRQLSLDFKEVIVTRRIFRSGESEYYINKAQCRLKDIHELFADTGLGRDALSVISQNKIDQVLNSKPEERRVLFEEAAGITKYRNRKRESLRKLDDTQQNILRVSDIISEIENQLEPLSESAIKTQKYNELNENFRRSKLTVLMNNFDKYNDFLSDSKKQKNLVIQDDQNISTQLNLQEVVKEQLNNELVEVEKSLQLLVEKNNELNVKIEKNNSDIAVCQERMRQSEENKLRFKADIEVTEKKYSDTKSKLNRIQENLVQFKQESSKVETLLLEQMEIEQQLIVKIKNAEDEITRIKENSFIQMQNLVNETNKLNVLKRDIEKLKESISSLDDEKSLYCLQIETEQSNFAKIKNDLANLVIEIQKSDSVRKQFAFKIQEFTDQIKQVNLKINTWLQILNEAKTRLRFLDGMQKEYEGFGKATKIVLKNNFLWNLGVCGAVAEIISVPDRFITAIEIALGGNLQNVVTENDSIAKQAIAYLKKEKLGRVTFLPLNTIVTGVRYQNDKSIADFAGFIGYADQLVSSEPKYNKIIEYLLGRTIVVTNIDVAVQLAKKQNFKVRIVTLEGELLNPGGSLTGGSGARREASFLNRASEIESVKKKIVEAERNLEEYQLKKVSWEGNLEQYQQKVLLINNEQQQIQVKQAELRVYSEKSNLELDRNKALLENLSKQFSLSQGELNKMQSDILKAEENISILENLDFVQKTDDENAVLLLKDLNVEKNKITENLVDVKIKSRMLQQQILQNEEMSQTLSDELKLYQQNVISLQNDFDKMQHNLHSVEKQLTTINTLNIQLKDLKNIAEKDYNNFHMVKLDKLAKVQDNDKEIRELRKKNNELQNRIHQIDILHTKYQFEVDNCLEQLEKIYAVSIEEAKATKLNEDNDTLNKQIKILEMNMAALGNINPNAIQEYEALNERFHFMQKQANDLIIAKEYLDGIIKEIDTTMSKQFIDAFAKINEFFGDIFIKLFGGGQAKLELLNDNKNVLEAGIEISVQPPDKKLQSLSVLSGGERALTVIALLFAFLSFKPAPFSVVDEIDAPLDEANVNRFGSFLKEFAGNTQFIVVTHRKGTMQVADVMHGVTVQDSGVSKVISVKLEDEIS